MAERFEIEERLEGMAVQSMTCGCCFENLKEPTTLTCGHTFCRVCIAKWYLSSGRKICPTCRQVWYGMPKVNVFMRSMSRRNLTVMEPIEAQTDEQNILDKFEKMASSAVEKDPNDGTGKIFCSGICFSIMVSFIIYIGWYFAWDRGNTNMLLSKPVAYWTASDVCDWLSGMGSWTDDYVAIVRQMEIKGSLLLVMGEEEVDSMFNVTLPLHRKALLKAIDIVREHGTKVPSNIWEFKSLYPGRTLFLSYGLKDFPRTTLLYLYFFQYKNLFLPFLHAVCPMDGFKDVAFMDNTLQLVPSQWVDFLPKFIFLPYWLIAVAAWHWIDTHYWVSRLMLFNCLAMTLLEIGGVKWFFTGGWRLTFDHCKTVLKSYMSIGLFALLWPIIPSILCNLFFYIAILLSPIMNLIKFYKYLREGIH